MDADRLKLVCVDSLPQPPLLRSKGTGGWLVWQALHLHQCSTYRCQGQAGELCRSCESSTEHGHDLCKGCAHRCAVQQGNDPGPQPSPAGTTDLQQLVHSRARSTKGKENLWPSGARQAGSLLRTSVRLPGVCTIGTPLYDRPVPVYVKMVAPAAVVRSQITPCVAQEAGLRLSSPAGKGCSLQNLPVWAFLKYLQQGQGQKQRLCEGFQVESATVSARPKLDRRT